MSNDIPSHERPVQASSGPVKRTRMWNIVVVLQGGFYKVLFYKETDMELFSTDDIVDDL